MVYSYVFVTHHLICPLPSHDKGGRAIVPFLGRHYSRFRLRLNVLLVCRQVHDEASSVLYGRNTFSLHSPYHSDFRGFSHVRYFMETIGPRYRDLVRKVEFSAGWRAPLSFDDISRTQAQIAFAILLTCFRLRSLTVIFGHHETEASGRSHSLMARHTLILPDRNPTTRTGKQVLQQANLELSAWFKAIEACPVA